MAAFDIDVIEQTTNAVDTRTYSVKANTKAINNGELVIVDGSNAGYATTIASGAQATTSNTLIGIAATTSTQTASADGTVDVIVPANGRVLRVTLKALTPASLANSQRLAVHTIDCSAGGVFTFDQGTTANGIIRMESFDNTTQGNVIADLICNYH
jgi:hypothetical protein